MPKSKYTAIKEIEKAQSNCAIVGIYGHTQASLMIYYMLHAMQHRGQEATGITTFFHNPDTNHYKYASHRRNGLVLETFHNPKVLSDKLIGNMAIGHNRYATTGSAIDSNIQPLNMKYKTGILALSHNGNLTNTNTLRRDLQNRGAIFHTTTDSELFYI